jgi:hypothetical protein
MLHFVQHDKTADFFAEKQKKAVSLAKKSTTLWSLKTWEKRKIINIQMPEIL